MWLVIAEVRVQGNHCSLSDRKVGKKMLCIRFKRLPVIFFLVICIIAEGTVLAGCQVNGAQLRQDNKKAVAAGKRKESAGSQANTLKIAMDLGEVVSLPLGEGEEILSISSNRTKIVQAAGNGKLYALKQGKAKVKAEIAFDDEVHTRVYHIKVKKYGMVYPVFKMMKGEHLDLQFNREDAGAVWKSQNPKVVQVSKKGTAVARKKGTAVLMAETNEGKIYRCRIKVSRNIKNVIYLTFDDGPNRYSTPKILDILKKNGVKATFFELKPAKNDFDLTKRILDEGHTLALHGYQHKYDIVYQSQKIYRENLDKLRALFFKKFGVWCTISRFPGGSSNTRSRYNPGIMTKLTKKVHGWGYHYFDWNVDSGDAGGARSAKDTLANFRQGLQQGRGNVVLMHDFYKNDKTIDALDKMIKYGKKMGYRFLPITASTNEVHHGVNN